MADKTYQVVSSGIGKNHKRIYGRRKWILRMLGILVLLALLILAGIYLYTQTREYTKYRVLASVERQDSDGTQFAQVDGNILKYGKDGAFCIGMDHKVIWSQTYEMQAPMADICEEYVAIADRNGKNVFLMDKSGPCGEIETTLPIKRIQVASQGTVAILMEQDRTGYLQMYGKDGAFLAGGELHMKNSGYPLDIALSDDGKDLAVSLLDIKEGSVDGTVVFYNFDSGQHEIDYITGQYTYKNLIFPQIEFLSEDTMVAFGNGKAIIYDISKKPKARKEIDTKREIQSVFYNEAYFGLVFQNDNSDSPYHMDVYDLRGAAALSQDFNISYKDIGFLENDEIYIHNELECSLYTLRGVEKFHSNVQKSIYKIIYAGKGTEYVFLLDGETQRIRLK